MWRSSSWGMPAITMTSSRLSSGNCCISTRKNHRFQIRAAGQNLLTARGKLAFGPDRQCEQVEQGIQRHPAAQLFEVEPRHLFEELLQRLGGAQAEPAVGSDHHHRPVLHSGMVLQKAVGLCRQAVVEARIRVHLHFQEHHRKLGQGLPARPVAAVDVMQIAQHHMGAQQQQLGR